MGEILLEVLFILCGLVALSASIYSFKDRNHPTRLGSTLFWGLLALIFIFGPYIPKNIVGIIIIVMAILTATRQVRVGNIRGSSEEFRQRQAERIGNKIFIPALMIAIFAFGIAQYTDLGGLVGLGIGALAALVIGLIITKSKTSESIEGGSNLLQQVGSSSLLPQILAALGALFNAAGVGEVISAGISRVIPQGNIVLGLIAYFAGMVIFTMIMGNAFAAFSVITVGVGAPFVLSQGADPAIIGALAMTAGYCGTLLTPMAANFNIVPAAILEMRDEYGVIKTQIPVALTMFVIHIIVALLLAF
ncbi:MAG: DUF979 domain-containing protein [Tissierellia bacterium]|nr:DUF979 domain-containing protein [Tissierellia bacterium]